MTRQRGEVRIIGGRWRNSRLAVVDVDGLRPTSDRVRETLFNWLQPDIPGARCLDLFAGSGALGFEAASRGAAAVTLVDDNPAVVEGLQQTSERLRADTVTIHRAEALAWLRENDAVFDVVFVDPPFGRQLDEKILEHLVARDSYGQAIVYLEQARQAPAPASPWEQLREGKTKEVAYGLYRRVRSR